MKTFLAISLIIFSSMAFASERPRGTIEVDVDGPVRAGQEFDVFVTTTNVNSIHPECYNGNIIRFVPKDEQKPLSSTAHYIYKFDNKGVYKISFVLKNNNGRVKVIFKTIVVHKQR